MSSATSLDLLDFPLPGFGDICVLDQTGDSRIQWDQNDPEQVAKAQMQFDEFRRLNPGSLAYKRNAAGENEVIHAFDPSFERIVLHKRMIGG